MIELIGRPADRNNAFSELRVAIESTLPSVDFTTPPDLLPFYLSTLVQATFLDVDISIEHSDRSSSAFRKYKLFIEECFRFHTLHTMPLNVLPDRNHYLVELIARVGVIVDSISPEPTINLAYKSYCELLQASYKDLVIRVSARYQHISIFCTNQIII